MSIPKPGAALTVTGSPDTLRSPFFHGIKTAAVRDGDRKPFRALSSQCVAVAMNMPMAATTSTRSIKIV